MIPMKNKEFYPVFSVNICLSEYAMNEVLFGAKDREDLIANFDMLSEEIMRTDEWRIKEIEGLYTDKPYTVLDSFVYYE